MFIAWKAYFKQYRCACPISSTSYRAATCAGHKAYFLRSCAQMMANFVKKA